MKPICSPERVRTGGRGDHSHRMLSPMPRLCRTSHHYSHSEATLLSLGCQVFPEGRAGGGHQFTQLVGSREETRTQSLSYTHIHTHTCLLMPRDFF